MSLYESFISRPDGLNHLLLSDVNRLMERMASEFPDNVKLNSIGKSFEGRDINYIELDIPNPDVKKKPAILLTGATHARELISTSLNIYQALKLLKSGVIQKEEKYFNLLRDNKFIFIPVLNVDGVAYIEKNWETDHKIVPQRKNMDAS